jgi:hypothetical protein
MLLPTLSRIVGVISRYGGYRGTPSPLHLGLDTPKRMCWQAHINGGSSRHSKLSGSAQDRACARGLRPFGLDGDPFRGALGCAFCPTNSVTD